MDAVVDAVLQYRAPPSERGGVTSSPQHGRVKETKPGAFKPEQTGTTSKQQENNKYTTSKQQVNCECLLWDKQTEETLFTQLSAETHLPETRCAVTSSRRSSSPPKRQSTKTGSDFSCHVTDFSA